ncbi:hypothetical protein ACK8N7_10485 [Streptomyces griseobrunneus]
MTGPGHPKPVDELLRAARLEIAAELHGGGRSAPGASLCEGCRLSSFDAQNEYARGCRRCPGRHAKVFEVKQLVNAGFDGDSKLWYTDSEQVIPQSWRG